jgi:hypothetical protein
VDFYALAPPPPGSFSHRNLPNSSALVSLYMKSTKAYNQAALPVILTFGHRANSSDDFSEIKTIYNAPATEVFSGVYVREWIQTGSGLDSDAGKDNLGLFLYI